MDRHGFGTDRLRVAVKADGAELCSLSAGGHEVLWQAGPAWPKHAPNLFPVIGKLNGETLRHAGREYPMPKHGFARDRRFTWVEHSDRGCRLALTDDEETRRHYPFAFRLEISYAVEGDRLDVTYRVENIGGTVLPACVGGHPAFRWPLADGVPKEAHTMEFERHEPGPLRRVTPEGLIGPMPKASPVLGRVLTLAESLFADDALVFDPVHSRSLRYTAPGCPAVEVSWQGFRELGVWSKPADFVCVEPWHGTADEEGFTGDILEKPGILLVPPRESRELGFSIRVAP